MSALAPARIVNALTVDVEDYFQVQALADRFPRPSWEAVPRRVEANVDRLLELFAAASAHATFFTLGWIAERHPAMVRRIAAAGHELASHGYDHRRADQLTPTQLREDVRRSKRLIEDIGGCAVHGYRAPTFSIGAGNAWSYDILESEDYHYSSSLYPIRHDLYGSPTAPRFPFRPASGALWEMPLTTRRLCGRNYPCAGGGYFRLLPYQLSRSNLRRVNITERQPCIFYLHPWEIDAGQPRVRPLSLRSRVRHYTNIAAMPRRLERLLRDFAWGRMDGVFTQLAAPGEVRATAASAG
ncbi:MAG TPA: XrtA system polysaccharide deacetylase [Stellaceae bacterium]|nr:XrtA system polysaccharide deacetylase [Stellaceae bacterium]